MTSTSISWQVGPATDVVLLRYQVTDLGGRVAVSWMTADEAEAWLADQAAMLAEVRAVERALCIVQSGRDS